MKLKTVAGYVAGLALCLTVLGVTPTVSAAPAEQTLWVDSTISSELFDSNLSIAPWEAVYSAVPYGTSGGADTNGEYLFWGNAASITDGTYGIGQLKVGLSDPIGELADYYSISLKAALMLKCGGRYEETIVPSGDWLSVMFGVGFNDPTVGSYEQMELAFQPTSGSGGTNIHTSNQGVGFAPFEHAAADRPFTLAEIRAMYGIIWLRFSSTAFPLIPEPSTPKSLLLLYVQVGIFPETDYEPPPSVEAPAGSFILWPNADLSAPGFEHYPASPDEYFSTVNETVYFSDGALSYINSTWDSSHTALFELTNPSSLLNPDRLYDCYPFSVSMYDTDPNLVYINLYLAGAKSTFQYGAQPDWFNHTTTTRIECPDAESGYNGSWSVSNLADMLLEVTTPVGAGAGEYLVSQVGVLCVPAALKPSDTNFGSIVDWLGTGGGFQAIFGVLGFAGMIAIPAIRVLAYKSGDESGPESAGMAIFGWVLCLGLFMVGLI